MNIKFKTVSIYKEHCGDCGEMLKGNGSLLTPYQCSCGEWKYDYESKEFKKNRI